MSDGRARRWVGCVLTAALLGCDTPGTGDSAPKGSFDSATPCAPTDWYEDLDGDGVGAGAATSACDAPSGQVGVSGDCDDEDAAVYPGAPERCNGADDDCDGAVDPTLATWYDDADGDGYGDAATAVDTCTPGATQVQDATDCDDQDEQAHPGGDETCADGVDQDCDGADLDCPYVGDVGAETLLKLHGGAAGDDVGRLMAVGDVTGDGVDDLLAATWGADSYAGGGVLVPGPITAAGPIEDVGYTFTGDLATTYGAGRAIGIGDLDGDGVDDLGFGVPYATDCGFYVFLGPIAADRAVAAPDLRILGDRGTFAGHGADLGDINGDGVADAVIGAYHTSDTALSAGAVHILYGPVGADVDLVREADVTLQGTEAEAYAGRHVRIGGDIDGDGLRDFLVVAPNGMGMAPTSGVIHVVYGPGDVGDLGGADGRLLGELPGAALGTGVAIATGDVDDDGHDDVAAGAYYDATVTAYAGAAYLVRGPISGDVDLGAADVVVRGDRANTYAGSSVAIGDADGDDRLDFVVGAYGTDTSTGAAMLFYAPSAGNFGPGDADATFQGEDIIQFLGANTQFGDVDGDGRAELLIGATGEPTGGTNAGAVYVASMVR